MNRKDWAWLFIIIGVLDIVLRLVDALLLDTPWQKIIIGMIYITIGYLLMPRR